MERNFATWILLFLLCCSSNSATGLRILGIIPISSRSHFNIAEALFKGLAAKGHQVDVYNCFPQKRPIPNYRDFSLDKVLPQTMNNVSYELVQPFMNSVPSMKGMIQMGGNPACELLKLPIFQDLIKNPPKDPPYDLIIVEIFMADCYLAFGRHLDIPMIGIVTSLLFDWLYEPLGTPRNLAVDMSVFMKFSESASFLDRLTNFALSTFVTESFNYYIVEQDLFVKEAFGEGFPNVNEMRKDFSLVLVNYHPAIGGIRTWAPAVVPVGGLHIVDKGDVLPKDLVNWLNKCSNGFIFISFGSMVRIETFPRSVLEAFYASLKNLDPVCFLLKIAKPNELPPGLPKNARTETWVSQIEVLKHKNIKAFLTHGGLMGTLESIYFGVPMIGVPLFGDQNFNIESYVHKKIAVSLNLNEFTEEKLTSAMKEILINPIYRETITKLSKKFKDNPMSPVETSTYWIEYVARHGKHALRSPIVDLPWWKKNLLDIYGSIALAILTIVFIAKKVMCFIGSLFCSKKQTPSLKIKIN